MNVPLNQSSSKNAPKRDKSNVGNPFSVRDKRGQRKRRDKKMDLADIPVKVTTATVLPRRTLQNFFFQTNHEIFMSGTKIVPQQQSLYFFLRHEPLLAHVIVF